MNRQRSRDRMRGLLLACGAIGVVVLSACQTQQARTQPTTGDSRNTEDLLVVDCLLPAQIRTLGRNMTFLGPRRAIKTTGTDCEIRGGEYVSYDRADYSTALKVWLPSAQQGNSDAQVYVGEIYEKGLGVRADYLVAAAWYRKAAIQGNSRAQINLGYLYESGLGVPRDLTQAMNWYRKASGLTDGDLEFVSSVEAAKRQAATLELAAMREETTQLRERLRQAEARLAQSRKSLEAAKRKARTMDRQSRTPSGGGRGSGEGGAALKRELEQAQAERQRLLGALASQQNQARQLQTELDRSQVSLSEKRKQLQEAERSLERTKQELSAARLADGSTADEEARKLRQAAQVQSDRVQRQRAEISRLTGQLARTGVRNRELEQRLAARDAEVDELQGRLARGLEGKGELAATQRQLQSSQDERRRLMTRLAAVQLDAAELRRQEAQAQEKIGLLRNRLDAAELALSELRTSLSKRQAQRDAGNATEIARLKDAIAQREVDVESARREIADLQSTLAGQNREASAALAKAEQRQRELEDSLVRKDDEIASLSSRLDAALENNRNIQAVQKALAGADADRRHLADRLARQKLEESALAKELEQTKLAVAAGDEQIAGLRDATRILTTQLAQRETELGAQTQRVAMLEERVAEQARTLQARQQELAALESDRAGERSALEAKLTQALQDQYKQQQAVNERQNRIDELEKTLASTQQTLASSERKAARLQDVEGELREQQVRVDQQEREIERLRKDLRSSEQAVDTSKVASVVETREAGPTIEIIDPPLALTRGKPSVLLRAPSRVVELIGRVRPEQDLLLFKVNEKVAALTQQGLFREKVSLRKPDTPVNLVAIDRSGNRTSLDFLIVPPVNTASRANVQERRGAVKVRQGDVDFGTYHALIIGNQNYASMPNLETPANDAKELERVLRSEYSFNTRLLIDANRYQILSALNGMRAELTDKDNLLIYFAGHGELDNANLRGHWLPVDAEPESTANWISNVAITDILNAMAAKHILVIADSCYSGSMTRSSLARLGKGMSPGEKKAWYRIMAKARARAVLTSGGLKPVLDAGGEGHSIFTRALLDVLRGNRQILEGYKLYRQVQTRVKKDALRLNVAQDPQYAPLKFAGHEAGEFFFLPRSVAAWLPVEGVRLATR